MVDDEVGGQGGLVRSEAPDEEDVHLSDAFYPQEGGLDHVVADTGGSGLYQHLQSVPEDVDNGGQHDAEHQCSDGVNDGIL